jgi:ferredoxin-NADP reductase
MTEYQMTLVGRQKIARDTMAFWFGTNGAGFEFRAGQHADFVFTHPCMGSESDNSRTFSIASTPHDKEPIMIAMRMRQTAFKAALKAAALGTKFIVSRPRGSFTLHKEITRPAVFLAGGIGIAPVRSIQWATQERLPHKLYLFYSNRERDDAAFIEEFESMHAQNPNFILIPTVTGNRTIAWPYEKGHVNRDMLRRYLMGLNGPIYYIAGPSGMVTAISRFHKEHPYVLHVNGTEHRVDYEPAESSTGLFGGNSNWRGPVWFPINFLLIEALQKFHHFYGDSLKFELPTGSGQQMSLWEVAAEVSRRLTRIFLRSEEGNRPVYGGLAKFQSDQHWRDYIYF